MNKKNLWFTILAILMLIVSVVIRVGGGAAGSGPDLPWYLLAIGVLFAILAAWR